jgi:4-hydroxy-2-oxoheptanedioate aldolase
VSARGLRELRTSERPLLGTWCSIPSAYCVELLASVGFEWVCIDLQHGLVGEEGLPAMLLAADAAGIPALVRTRWNDPPSIMRALDFGAAGVIVPLVSTAEHARACASACRYPPLGERSWGPMRPLAGGGPSPADAICVVMVETTTGVEEVDEIASTPGIDGVFVGPSDLSLSATGRLGGDVAEHVAIVAAACRRAGILAGIACADADGAAAASAAGLRLLTLQWDVGMFASGALAALDAARGAVSSSARADG